MNSSTTATEKVSHSRSSSTNWMHTFVTITKNESNIVELEKPNVISQRNGIGSMSAMRITKQELDDQFCLREWPITDKFIDCIYKTHYKDSDL